jgi:hypothetical protein
MFASALILAAAMTLAAPLSGPGAGSPDAPVAQEAPTPAAPTEYAIEARRSRLAARIRTGRIQGWLDQAEMRDHFRRLRAVREREAEMRRQTGSPLSDAQRVELWSQLHDLSESLRHAEARNAGGHRRTPG